MTRLQKLREQRNAIKNKMAAMLKTAETEDQRSLNEQEAEQWDALESEYKTVTGEIERLERFNDIDAETRATAPEDQGAPVEPNRAAAMNDNQRGANNPRSYRSLFGRDGAEMSDGGFRSIDEFLCAVNHGQDDRLQFRALNEALPSSGGFIVPTEFSAEILDNALEQEIVRPLARVYPMSSAERKIPAWNGQDHTSTLFGGFSGSWLNEGETATETDGAFRTLTLTAKKLGIFTSASNELVSDAMNFDQLINGGLQSAIAWFMDHGLINGSGTSQPKGFLTSGAKITVAKESGQANSTIVFANITKMFSRMHAAGLGNAVWIANQTIIPKLLEMTIDVGTGGSHVNQIFSSEIMDGQRQFQLLTRPIFFTEKVPALGSASDISFVDLTQFAVGMRKEILIEKSGAVHWTSDKSAYRVIVRVDSDGLWNEAITPKNGDSLSWCVTLGARSA